MFKHIRMIKQLGLEQRMLAETPQPNTFVYTVDQVKKLKKRFIILGMNRKDVI